MKFSSVTGDDLGEMGTARWE